MTEYIGQMQIGNLFLVFCCIFYLIWWSIAFNPTKEFSMAPKVVLFLCTLATGVVGVILLVNNMSELPKERGPIPNAGIVVGAIVIYFVLLFLTYHFLHRQVTTELALIVGWTALELCVMNSLYRADAVGAAAAIVAAVIIVVSALIGMVCYLAYYELEAQAAFYDGMVPLILFALVMLFQIVLVGRIALS